MGKSVKRVSGNLHQPAPSRQKVMADALTAAGPGCSKAGLANFVHSLHQSGVLDSKVFGEEGSYNPRLAKQDFTDSGRDLIEIHTPYGDLVQSMALPLEDPKEELLLRYINPFAFLHHLSKSETGFGEIVKAYLKNQTNNLMIYFDETRPGNVLRPDAGRLVLAVYWSLKELPEYIRSRSVGWFPFTFIRSKLLARLPGKASNFAARILRFFFSSDNFNMLTGVRCEVNSEDIFVKAKFCGILGDEKALKESLGVTGSSGTKPCFNCKNIGSKHNDLSDHDYFVSLDCSKFSDLDLHTDSSFREMADLLLLHDRDPTMTKKKIGKLQQVLGLKYDKDTLLFQPDLKDLVQPISCTIWDWMHVLVSHGQADVELGLFVHKMVSETRISIKQLEDFVLQFEGLRQSGGKFNRNFLTSRLKKEGGPFKGFSGELLDLLPLVRTFVDMVLVLSGKMPTHIESFKELCKIVDIMTMGDAACAYVALLRTTIEKHYELFVECYGLPECIPKFHYTMHLAHVLERLQINPSCFVTERKHSLCKQIAGRTFNNFENTILQEVLRQTLREYHAEGAMDLEGLAKDVPLEDDELLEQFHGGFPHLTNVFANCSAKLGIGNIKRKDLVLLELTGFQVGRIVLFFKLVFIAQIPQFMAHVELFEKKIRVRVEVWRNQTYDRTYQVHQG